MQPEPYLQAVLLIHASHNYSYNAKVWHGTEYQQEAQRLLPDVVDKPFKENITNLTFVLGRIRTASGFLGAHVAGWCGARQRVSWQ